MIQETYKTIQSSVQEEIKVKGSRFVARAVPVTSKKEAEEKLGRISREFHDATHHCFAYRVGIGDGGVYRSSDAGEPAGTAGQPILQVIRGEGLTDVLVVVTRYFGGTKLGIGGLIKAYTTVTQEVLRKAAILEIPVFHHLELKTDYAHISHVMREINVFEARLTASDYRETIQLQVNVPAKKVSDFREALINRTGGQIKIKVVTEP